LLQYRGFPYYNKYIFIGTENIFAESVLFVYFRNMNSDKNKRERGRPALPADQRRTARSVTAMSPAEMRAADELAAIDGVPRSRAVANAVLETLERRVVLKLVDKVAQKLREVAVNYAERERETARRAHERGGLQPVDATVRRFAVWCEFARSPEEIRRKSGSRPEQRQELLEQLYAEAIRNRAEGYVSSFFQNKLQKPEDRERRIRVAQEAVEKIIAGRTRSLLTLRKTLQTVQNRPTVRSCSAFFVSIPAAPVENQFSNAAAFRVRVSPVSLWTAAFRTRCL